jgi:hypothetical protein
MPLQQQLTEAQLNVLREKQHEILTLLNHTPVEATLTQLKSNQDVDEWIGKISTMREHIQKIDQLLFSLYQTTFEMTHYEQPSAKPQPPTLKDVVNQI